MRRRVPLKYWTGFLTAGIIAAITWALQRLAENFGELVDMVYPYVMRTVQGFLAQWSSGVDFLIWQLLAVVLGIARKDKTLKEKLAQKLPTLTTKNWEIMPLHVEFQGAHVLGIPK